MDSKLGEHTAQLTDAANKLGGIDTKLGSQATTLGNMDSKLGEHTGKLTDVTNKLGGIDTKLEGQSTTLGTIDSKLGEHTEKLTDAANKLGGIDIRLGDHFGKLNSIDNKLTILSAQPVAPLELNDQGSEVEDLQGRLKALEIEIPVHESAAKWFGVGTQEALRQFQVKNNLQSTGILDEATLLALAKAIAHTQSAESRVEGRLFLDDGRVAANRKLLIKSVGFGGRELLAEGETDDQGFYAVQYHLAGKDVHLEVYVVDESGQELRLSGTEFNAERHSVFNLVAPARIQPPATEFERLAADLSKHLNSVGNLVAAREDAEHQDLTLLHQATGWDARLIAMAVITDRLCAEPEVKAVSLPKEAVYGLLRAGLPSDKLLLARVGTDVAMQALRAASKSGIIGLTDQQISDFEKAFASFSDGIRLNIRAPGSRSTYGDLLRASGLSQKAQEMFAKVYLDHRGAAAELWKNAANAGLGPNDIKALQHQGKLAFLTCSSEALTTRLQRGLAISDPVQLVERDFDQADKWKDEVRALAGGDAQKLDALIPPPYEGKDVEERLGGYAADMARKVRISYPTHVVGRLVARDQQNLFGFGAAVRAATTALLKNAADEGFRLGQTPVENFLKDHPEVWEGITSDQQDAVRKSTKTLQRVYQITSSNEAMSALLQLGLTSAYDVVAIPMETFLDRYGARFPSIKEAERIYRKAEQVVTVTYNLFAIAKKLDSDVPLYAASAPAAVKEDVKIRLIKQFPTMESLFGSLDFCECDHCRSVLSPAAYLVDLLHFLDPGADPEDREWEGFLRDWKTKHGGQEYTEKYRKPYDALEARRPDLPHIPLTCENTNTALPYIDVVNEILEYYVANKTLDKDAAHDTGDATTAELVAEPQNILPAAYETLAQPETRYPLNLPFDLWLETVRRFCDYSEMPLWRLLDAFRRSDDLFNKVQTYDRAAVFVESLGLSPAEYNILTDPQPLSAWWTLYGYPDSDQATIPAKDPDTGQRIDLHSAKALARRLGVTYKELAEVVRTGFVNPKLDALVVLSKLRVTINDVMFYNQYKGLLNQNPNALSPEDQKRLAEVQAFEGRLDDLSKQYAPFDAKDWLNTQLQQSAFSGILVLADPDSGCNFDETTLRYAGGQATDPIAFLKINLFVRLWRKLGWTIEETDRALQAFVPKNTPFDGAHLDKSPLRAALHYIAHLNALDEQVQIGRDSRLKLLTLWSPMATTGQRPLYARLFLTRNLLKTDDIFDDPLGRYLSKPNIAIADHMLALQGSLDLTADEIDRILTDAGIVDRMLTLENVSLLYRYGLLAKALKLSVRELISLKQLSGLNPFQPLHPDPPADTPADVNPPKKAIEFDYPFSQTLRFVEVVGEVNDSGLKVEDLDYLLRHRFDPEGKNRPDKEAALALMKTLAEGVRAIRKDHAVPDDPGAMGEDTLRQEMGLLFPPDVSQRFLAMLNGTAEFSATEKEVKKQDQLDPASFANLDCIRQASYNERTEEQKLTFRGVLLDLQKRDLEVKVPSIVFGKLLDNIQHLEREFFDKNFLKQGAEPAAGFLEDSDYALLFAPLPADADEKTKQEQLRKQRTRLVEGLQPFLQERLVRQFVSQTMTAHTGADAALVETLLTDAQVLGDPRPLVEAFSVTANRGLSVMYYASPDCSGPPSATFTLGQAETGLSGADGKTPLKPAGTMSARFQGYLEVPSPGAYRFYAVLDDKDAEAELRFDHLPDVFLKGTATRDKDEFSEYLDLKAGAPYRFTLEFRKLGAGDGRLLVRGETLPKDSLAQLTLYPDAVIERALRALILLRKVLQLLQTLQLDGREVRYLCTHSADFGDLSFSELPTREEDDTPVAAKALFSPFEHLARYSRLKRDMAGGSDGLISVFEAKRVEEAYPLIGKLIRRGEDVVKATAIGVFAVPVFPNEEAVQRLWEALQVVERLGVPVNSITKWTRIVSASATATERYGIARDLKETVKARFDTESWQGVAQPIFDKLRQRQRDALVAYVMQQLHLERIEQLYEHFLLDPGMEPVVQSSRIRLAISSVQLFINRCLLNLEKEVSPSAINASQWEWMKRYRVWEANRKIFLFPENWLEPEFRDDKTHLFRELESNLLQGDVSSDLVEDAFLNYLKKLEELARLDIVAMHIDSPDPISSTLHVIGRTYSQPHRYFYRRYAHQMWTPWEPVTAEIEGDHLAPVIWRDRLYLFWVTFMDKPDENPKSGSNTTGALAGANLQTVMSDLKAAAGWKQIEMKLHWSEHVQGEWSTPRSGEFTPVVRSGEFIPLPLIALNEAGSAMEIAAHEVSVLGVSAQIEGHTSITLKPKNVKVPIDFNPKTVFIHVSKEAYENDEERGVFVHLGCKEFKQSFYLAGRNCTPERSYYTPKLANPYSPNVELATRYSGGGRFQVTFNRTATKEDGKPAVEAEQTLDILAQGKSYTMLPCDISIDLGSQEISSLVSPVFYQDNAHTLFIEPSLTEKTIDRYEEWVTSTPGPELQWQMPDWLKEPIIAMVPLPKLPIPAGSGDPILDQPTDPGAQYQLKSRQDWIMNPATVLRFDEALIGPRGSANLVVLPVSELPAALSGGGITVQVQPGSNIATDNHVVASSDNALAQAGLAQATGGLNVIGASGFNSTLAKNLSSFLPAAGKLGGRVGG
jgi:hypothetical protein